MIQKNFEKEYNEKKYKSLELETILYKLFPNYGFELTDTYDFWDVTVSEIKVLCELKNRFFDSKFFDIKYNGEMLLEKDKCERLLKATSSGKYKGYKAIYCFYFKDDVYEYIVLNKIDFSKLKTIQIKCPKNSFEHDSEYIYKDCYIIPKSVYTKSNHVRRSIN
jgi:hypothetical protein